MRLLPDPLPLPAVPFLGSLALACLPWLAGAAGAQCPLGTSFATSVALPNSPLSSAVYFQRAADFDGDGLVDLVVGRSGQPLALQRNLGSGAFFAVAAPPLGTAPRLEVADYDLDGRVDFVVTRAVPFGTGTQWDLAVEFWRNTTTVPGIPTFALTDTRLLGAPLNQSIGGTPLVGDVDADGIPDVVVLRNATTTLHGAGAHGVPSGAFGAATVSPSNLGSTTFALLFDVNQDHLLDVVSGTGYYANAQLGLAGASGRPTGAFAAPTFRSLGSTTFTASVADLDGDGLLDIVGADQSQLTLRRGLAGFQFAAPIAVPVSLCETPFFGDFDRDGALEICVPRGTQYWNQNVAFVDDPLGAATVSLMQIAAGYPVRGVTADFDGDGRLDFAIGKDNGEVVCGRNTCSAGSPAQITVVTPNGGETWTVGTLQTLHWAAPVAAATYDVDVSFDGGLSWRPIARAVAGTSCDVWATEPSTNLALVRVQPTGLAGLGDVSDAFFAIGGPGLAAATLVGTGCGAPNPMLTFATAPKFGGVCTIAAFGAVPTVPVSFWLSLPAAAPLPFGPNCFLHLEPSLISLVALVAADAQGIGLLAVGIPTLPGLGGLEVAVQTFAFASTPPAGQIGNAVTLLLGF